MVAEVDNFCLNLPVDFKCKRKDVETFETVGRSVFMVVAFPALFTCRRG